MSDIRVGMIRPYVLGVGIGKVRRIEGVCERYIKPIGGLSEQH